MSQFVKYIPTTVPKTIRTRYAVGLGAGSLVAIIILLVAVCLCSVSLIATNWTEITDFFNSTFGTTEMYRDTTKERRRYQ